jgi:hypothetical protein
VIWRIKPYTGLFSRFRNQHWQSPGTTTSLPTALDSSYSDAKVANRKGRGSGWEIAHAAVSRRPPINLDTTVARTLTCTRTARAFGICPSFKDQEKSPAPNPTFDSQPLRLCTTRVQRGSRDELEWSVRLRFVKKVAP